MIRGFIKVVKKGWGWEEWIENSPMYCAKWLIVKEGKRCSLHHHEKKFETFFLNDGVIDLEVDGEVVRLVSGDIVDIRPYQNHRFVGIGTHNVILEVSTQHFESDSIRIEKG